MSKRKPKTSSQPVTAKVKKVILNYHDSDPENEPLFVNNFQVIHVGTDVFIDAGIVPVDDILAAKDKGEVRFLLLTRLAMSVNAFAALHKQMTEIFEKLQGAKVLDDALQNKT